MILHFVLQPDHRSQARRLDLNGQRNGNGTQKACASSAMTGNDIHVPGGLAPFGQHQE